MKAVIGGLLLKFERADVQRTIADPSTTPEDLEAAKARFQEIDSEIKDIEEAEKESKQMIADKARKLADLAKDKLLAEKEA